MIKTIFVLVGLMIFMTSEVRTEDRKIPDEQLIDQDGRAVRIYSDLIKGKTVAINFIYTTCTAVCGPLGASFGKTQKGLEHARLISISLDPENDTPEKLKSYAAKFGRKPGWTLLTGDSKSVSKVIKALGELAVSKEAHSASVLVGNDSTGQWTRIYGLNSADRIINKIKSYETEAAAKGYFTDTELTDQNGRKHRFYSDLIRQNKVMINFAFASCKGGCSPITRNLASVQKILTEKRDSNIRMLTITVDPRNDTSSALKKFAEKFGARKGWYFLTGSVENVERVLKKIGGYTPNPDAHSMVLLIGDDATGVWTKANALDKPELIANAILGLK